MIHHLRFSLLAGLCLAGLAASAAPTTGFIENKGQVHTPAGAPVPAVRYLLPLPGMNVQLRAGGFSYDSWTRSTTGTQRRDAKHPFASAPKTAYQFHRVDVGFEGSRPGATLQASGAGTDVLNYYGAASEGAVGVHHFGTVTYKEVWTGIDVEFQARQGSGKPVEYNFILHPGARVSDIRLRYEGADAAALKDGALRLTVAGGTLTETIPASYWAGTNLPVDVRYTVLAQDGNGITVGFAAPSVGLKCRKPLVIDPTPNISWATYYGGADYDMTTATAGDSLGNSYITGSTSSISAIATAGAHQTTLGNGFSVAYAAKFNAAGVRQWGTYYGSDEETGYDIGVDATGSSVYLAGNTSSSTGIATTGAHQSAFGGGFYDGFVVKFNSTGARQWATYYGGAGDDYCTGVVIDGSGNPNVCGATASTTAIASTGAHQTSYGGSSSSFGDPGDGFVVKFNSSGVRQWGTYYGGTQDDYTLGIGVDGTGAIYASGTCLSTSGISTSGAHQATLGGSSGAEDAFLVKFSSSGVRQWGTYYGGSDYEFSYDVAVRSNGDVYLCGSTASTTGISTTGAHQISLAGGGFSNDAFAAKFNSSGVRQWGTYYGGTSDEQGSGIATDSAGNVYLCGTTGSSSGISTTGAYKTSLSTGGDDAFLAMFNTAGTRQWGTYYGGNDYEYTYFHSVAISGKVGTGNEGIHIGGETYSTTGISTTGAHQTAIGSTFDGDGFFTRFNNCVSTATPPGVSITAVPGNNVCAEVPVTFTATVTGGTGTTLRWLRNNLVVAGATGTTFTIATLANGDYIRAVVSKPGSCGDTLRDSSNVITMTIKPLPVPTINAAGAVLSTQAFTSYQWLRNGTLVTGATGQSYTATTSGTYRVIVTASNGCSDTSAPFNFTTAVHDVDGAGAAIRVFPNPTSGILRIESAVAVDAVVGSLDGRVLLREERARELRLDALPDGMYLVSLTDRRTGAVIRVEKVIKGKL